MAIYLYGQSRKQFGEVIDCNVNSVTELIKAAEALRPGFKDHIQKDRKYIIRRGTEFKKAKEVGEEEIEMRFKDTDWHIVPMPIGYGGVFKAILGAVLIVVGVITWSYGGGTLVGMGIGMMAGGIAEMLAPTISTNYDNDKADQKASFLFNGPTNRVAAGNAVPLVYGFDVFIGSLFLSGGLEIGDIYHSADTSLFSGLTK